MGIVNEAGGRSGPGLDPIVPTLLLIDPIGGEPIPGLTHAATATASEIAAARHHAWGREVCAITLDERVPLARWQAPYLVEMAGADDAWIDESLSIAGRERASAQARGLTGTGRGPHRIGAWLQSQAFAPALAEHLSALMRVRTAAYSGRKRYLRLADPRVFDLWRWQCGDAAAGAALGPIVSWQYLDAAGRWARLERPHDGQTGTPPFLSDTQWHVSSRSSAVHDAIAMWFGELSLAGQPCPRPDSIYAQVIASLDRTRIAARRWPRRFQCDDDHVAWAALSLLCPGLQDDGRVLRALDEPVDEGDTSARLHAIAAELADIVSQHRQTTPARPGSRFEDSEPS